MGGVEAFNRLVDRYEHWFERNHWAYESEVLAFKQVMGDVGAGLEVGVGTGRFASRLGISYGIDPSVEMLKRAKDAGIRSVVGVGEALPFGQGSFDTVLLSVTVCFLDDPLRTFHEVRRVLRRHGSVIVGFVDKEGPLGRIYQEKTRSSHFYAHARFFSTTEIVSLLKGAGLALQDIVQVLSDLPQRLSAPEQPSPGHGSGGFVVIRATLGP